MALKVCTPVYRRELMEPRMTASVWALLAEPDFDGSEWQTAEGTVISYNRNRAMQKGTPLAEFSHALFVDSDTAFTPDHVRALLARDVPVVSAAVEARGFPGKVSAAIPCEVQDPLRCRPNMTDTGLREVVWVGAGMLLVRTAVFADWPNPWRYGTMPDGMQIGEDVQLCLDLRDKGYQIWLDCDCKVEHIGANRPKPEEGSMSEGKPMQMGRVIPAQPRGPSLMEVINNGYRSMQDTGAVLRLLEREIDRLSSEVKRLTTENDALRKQPQLPEQGPAQE